MSQKAIKKRTIETFKHALHIPVKPVPKDNQKLSKSLPAKSFPLNKFIALPDGLKVKSSKSKTEDIIQPRRTIPIKAVAVSSSSSSYGKGDKYVVGPEGSELTNTHNIGVNIDRKANDIKQNNSSAPLSTSTPRAERKSRERKGYRCEARAKHTRPVTPTGSITSVDSQGSTRKGLYKKRSESTPPDFGRQRLQSDSSDVVLSKWSNNDPIPGLTRTTSYQTVQDGVTIESDNWSIANVTSLDGRIQTVYKTNTGGHNSLDTSHDSSIVSRSSLPLEFTDVCNLNLKAVTPNDYYIQDYTTGDFVRSRTNSINESLGVNSDLSSLNDSTSGFVQGPHYATLPRNYKVVKSFSEMNVDKVGKIKMDKMNNSSQLSVHNKSFEVNGRPQTGLLIYKPGKSGEIVVNDQHPGMPNGGYEFLTVGRKEGSLVKSKLKFNSMPTLFDSKGDKKLIKLLKKQEKEEKRRKEKEERKRAKEEKKRAKLEKKLKTKTLPRNFQYAHTNGHVLSPLDQVYRRPKLSLSAVPIDFEDGPARHPSPIKMAPPPPPEPSMRTRSIYASAPDLLRVEQVYGATIRGVPKDLNQPLRYSEYAPRTVVLQRASEGYGFVLRGAKSQLKPNGELDFRPTAEFPALQYLDSIDPGSAADRAGLKPGDFILEINGENVVRASHDRVVNLIRGTGDTLAMKVVTVRAGSRSQDWFNQNSYSSTMPNRKKKAPQPPQRDPRTSLSFSRSEGQSVSEELAIMEKLDQAILERKTSGEEKKTASIRSKLAAKRVSSVELESIGVNPNQETKTGPNGYLERSRSQPNLVDGSVKHIYAVPGVNQATTASVIVNDPNISGVRPKGPPPQPPGAESQGRKQAPKPPTQNIAPKSEVVTIDTRKSSPYASTKVAVGKENSKTESVYESSFRPGISAKLSDEPPVTEQSKLKSSLHHETSAGVNVKSNTTIIHTGDDLDKPSVSFAEDKVFDNAATFLKKHPNAKLLVTAEVHNKMKNRNSSVYEPEPDYDQEDSGEEVHKEPSSPVKLRENRQSVTVISIGEKEKQKESNTLKRYTIHSTIPTDEKKPTGNVIPPRPEGPAPIPPTNKSSQSFPREVQAEQSSRISFAKSSAPAPPKEEAPPPLPPTPPPDMDLDEVDAGPAVAMAPAPPAPAPPPPPPPPPPQTEELKKMPSFVKADYIPPIPKDDIASAVLQRQKRIEEEGLRVTPQKPKTFQDQKESNQAAILAAVANRRKQLEQVGENTVVESIESRLQRTKKLQAAKFNFASSKPSGKKEPEKDESKSNDATKSNSNTLEKSVKKEKLVPKPIGKPEKETTAAKPHELSFKVKPSSPTSKSPTEPKPKTPGLTEIKPNFKVKTAPKTPVSTAIKTDKPKVEVKKVETIPKPVSNESENKDVISKNENNMNGKSDFLALAEKKRQELLQRKSQKSPTDSKTNSARSSVSSSPEKEKFKIKKNSPPTQPKPNSKFPVKGVTIDQSETEHQTSKGFVKVRSLNMNGDVYTNDDTNSNDSGVPPPPPGFRDGGGENTVVHLEIIPPPATFSSDSGVDLSHQHSPAFSPDTASLVSSLSTLSSLSGDQNEMRSANSGYDDLIAPPPPGFGDDDASTVIPPPPEFGIDKEKAFTRKSVESWLCNDVLDWLDSIKMSQYKKSFQSNCIDGKKLLELTRNDYLKLEVTQVSHRMNIERSIKKAAIKQNVGASDIIASERL